MERALLPSCLVLCFAAMVSAKCTITGEECRDLLDSLPPYVSWGRLSCHRYSAMRTKCCGEPHNPRVALASVCALSGTDARHAGFDMPRQDSGYTHGDDDQCQSVQKRSITVQLSGVWGDATASQANSIRRGRLNVCLYPTRNQSGRHRVTLSAEAYIKPDQLIGTSKTTQLITGTRNGKNPRCGQRPLMKECQYRDDKPFYAECVWKRIDVTDAIKKAIQMKQSHVKFVIRMEQTPSDQGTDHHGIKPKTCFSYRGNGATGQAELDSTRPFITFTYRQWKLNKRLKVQINRAPDNTRKSVCDFGGQCQLQAINLNFSTLAKQNDNFIMTLSQNSSEKEDALVSGFQYNICAGHCTASEEQSMSIGEIFDQPQNTCATVYESEPKTIHGRYKWENGAITMHFKQWSAKACYCNTHGSATREMLETDTGSGQLLLTSTA
eukprot:scpid75443/ scgid8373/ 